MDLSEIAQDLYAVPPHEFIAARKESAAAVRAAGNTELSNAIGALRKPSAPAAVVNLLARHSEDLLQEVADLGEDLRTAQEQGDGKRLRALNEERKALLKRVAAEGAELAEEHDLSYGPAVARGVDETIKAALADPRAAEAVQAGLLVTALSGAGLGFNDLADSVALPNFELKPRESHPKERRLRVVPDLPDPATARADAAREVLKDATELAEEADSALEVSEAARDANESTRTALHKRLDALKQELKELQVEVSAADDAVRDLDRAVVQATKARDAAHKELTRAKDRLDRLT
jgi:chromosome segregation ATPase